ncbi:MAG: phosphonate utilization associated transcriptional regulator [Usitatibacter sp.]
MVTAPPPDALELLRSQSLTTLVHRELERRILAGVLAPGDKINEEDIAGQLSVSRGPVREAFRALESSGLVRMEKNRGVFVRQVSLAEADEIYEVRAGLDELVGRLLAERITSSELRQLRDLLTRMQQAARAKDVDAYYPLNVTFHDRLVELTGNRTLIAAYRRLVNELHLYRRQTLERGADSFPISTREHAEIVDALARKDADKAGKLLYEHAMESRDRLHAALEPQDKAPARRQ